MYSAIYNRRIDRWELFRDRTLIGYMKTSGGKMTSDLTKTDDLNCPKCDRPESATRWKNGKKFSICGNGHDWDKLQQAAQRAKTSLANEKEKDPSIQSIDWRLPPGRLY